MKEELFIFWLALDGHIGKVKYDALVEVYGNIGTAFESIRKGRFYAVKGFGNKGLERLRKLANPDMIYEKFGEMREKGINFSDYFSKEYPDRLKGIYSAPIGLFYKGRLPNNEEKIISIVGARDATEKGMYYSEKIARELSENFVSIASGMALGIDTSAHLGALKGNKGYTYAILGCGADICYPKNNIELYMEIAKKGGIISELPMGMVPAKANFPNRNRIISGISDGIFVVEAREKSGSLITAEMGLEQGKNIYAFPGRNDEPLSAGTNRLIQSGAKLVNGVKDILEDFDFQDFSRGNIDFKNLILERDEKIVYSTLCLEPKHISDIIEETGLNEEELFSSLIRLEIRGYVKRTSFEYYVIKV